MTCSSTGPTGNKKTYFPSFRGPLGRWWRTTHSTTLAVHLLAPACMHPRGDMSPSYSRRRVQASWCVRARTVTIPASERQPSSPQSTRKTEGSVWIIRREKQCCSRRSYDRAYSSTRLLSGSSRVYTRVVDDQRKFCIVPLTEFFLHRPLSKQGVEMLIFPDSFFCDRFFCKRKRDEVLWKCKID